MEMKSPISPGSAGNLQLSTGGITKVKRVALTFLLLLTSGFVLSRLLPSVMVLEAVHKVSESSLQGVTLTCLHDYPSGGANRGSSQHKDDGLQQKKARLPGKRPPVLRSLRSSTWNSLSASLKWLDKYELYERHNILTQAKVGLVTSEFYGEIGAGDTAEHIFRIAEALSENGAAVTVFLTGEVTDSDAYRQSQLYNEHDMRFVQVPTGTSSTRDGSVHMKRAHDVYLYLSESERRNEVYDILLFLDTEGAGYYVFAAKEAGIAFQRTMTVLLAFGSSKMDDFFHARKETDSSEKLILYSLERKCVELAQMVLSPSESYLKWMADNGYRLDRKRAFTVHHLPLSEPVQESSDAMIGSPGKKLAFFGRLDDSDDVDIFLQAIEYMIEEKKKLPESIVFIEAQNGMFSRSDLERYHTNILSRIKGWPMEVDIIDVPSAGHALSMIRQEGYIMINPTIGSVASLRTADAIMGGVPIISSGLATLNELYNTTSSISKVSFMHGNSRELAERISEGLSEGIAPFAPIDSLRKAKELYAVLAADLLSRRGKQEWDPDNIKTTRVSVGIPDTAGGPSLERTISALMHLISDAHPTVSEILVAPESIEVAHASDDVVVKYGKVFSEKGVQLHMLVPTASTSWSPADVRNEILEKTSGEYLFLLPAGHLPLPDSLKVLLRCAQRTNAALVTPLSQQVLFTSHGSMERRSLHLGIADSLEASLYQDITASKMMLLEVDAIRRVGAFTDDVDYPSSAFAEWELQMKLIYNEVPISLVPDVLVFEPERHGDYQSTVEEIYYGHVKRVETFCSLYEIPRTTCTSLIYTARRLSLPSLT